MYMYNGKLTDARYWNREGYWDKVFKYFPLDIINFHVPFGFSESKFIHNCRVFNVRLVDEIYGEFVKVFRFRTLYEPPLPCSMFSNV